VNINVFTMDGLINFTPDMQFAIQAQYDNISQSFRLPRALSLGVQAGQRDPCRLGPIGSHSRTDFQFQTTALSVRIGHTLRF
jgi:hypothetical protein